MSEEPNHSESQEPTTPAQPKDISEPIRGEASGAPGAAARPGSRAPSDPGGNHAEDGVPEVGRKDTPASAERPADEDASPPVGADVTAEEVEAAMQEMRVAEPSGLRGVTSGAGRDQAPRPAAEEGEAILPEVSDSAEQGSTANAADVSPAPGAVSELPPDATPFEPQDFAPEGQASDTSPLDLLDDVELDVKVELGRTEMYIEDVLGLGAGSVVELDKAAGDPVDIFVNERLVARGEVLVLNDNFCVRINDIISPVPELEEER